MAAYSAVISLMNTIDFILHSFRIRLSRPSREIMQLAYRELQPLQDILERLDSSSKSKSRKKVNALDGRIKETIWSFEDLLESLLSDQIILQFESPPHQLQLRSNIQRRRRRRRGGGGRLRYVLLFSIDMQRLKGYVDSFIQMLKDMEEEYIYELDNMPEDDDGEYISPRCGFGGMKSKMIGFSDQIEGAKNDLMREYHSNKQVYGLIGMAGVGKTTLANEIYEDPSILSHFECRAWVTVGRKSGSNQVSRGILAQLDPNITFERDEEIVDYLRRRLEGKKCLIVLDDVWEGEAQLLSSLPDLKNGIILILLTSRDGNVMQKISKMTSCCYRLVRFLNEDETKGLLCHKVFGGETCPPPLEKAVAKIAKICEGLPLMIVTVADHLSKAHNSDPEYWNDVAERRNSVITDAFNEISKVLFPSYNYLPQHLKMFFLYLGVFPQDYEIIPSKIINMLTAEGWFLDTNQRQSLEIIPPKIINVLPPEEWFLDTNQRKSFEGSVMQCLGELSTHNILVVSKLSSIFWYCMVMYGGVCKTCRLHSSWRHLCREEARKNKFYHVLNRLVDGLEEDIKGQRCLCLQNNILFGIKEFCNSVKCNCASSTRSLLFFGPYHQYPIPIGVGFKLLRELDALQLRFYAFPIEILTLVQLKYLALTCNGELPTTISKLFNLRVLIIHPHINIKYCCRAPSYIPIQIWDMHELEHIEILGKSLRAPPNHVACLKKVSSLVGVNASIYTISELLERIPNIRKLVVQMELTPYDYGSNLLSCFDGISTLDYLKSLKCSISNPVVKYGYFAPCAPSSFMFQDELGKLDLSGMGFPWEYMDVIGSLQFLKVLKLRSYAFRGSKWETQEDSFCSLEFLLIEDSDLVQWKPRSGSFPVLSYLSMKHCYKLQELHWRPSASRTKIELVNCNPLVLAWASQLQPKGITHLHVTASSSFDEPPTTIEFERLGS